MVVPLAPLPRRQGSSGQRSAGRKPPAVTASWSGRPKLFACSTRFHPASYAVYWDMPDERARVRAAATACHAALGHAQGAAWLVCVQTTLIQEPPGFPVQQEATLLKDLLLDYTCDVDDGGTPAIRSVMWSWKPTGSAAVPVSLRVDVLQESPPILLVDDFVSDAECQYMVNASMGDMMPSPGYPSSGTRRSYSASLFPKWDLEGDVVARVSRRLVAFAREVGGYPDIPEVGQEPLSTVYYREAGDEFRSHCDGECRGGAYWAGRRIATSLTYCQAAQESAARPNAAPLACLLSLGLLSLGLPSHRSRSRLASPGTAVPLAQPCNTPPTVSRRRAATRSSRSARSRWCHASGGCSSSATNCEALQHGQSSSSPASSKLKVAALGSGRAGHPRLEVPSH